MGYYKFMSCQWSDVGRSYLMKLKCILGACLYCLDVMLFDNLRWRFLTTIWWLDKSNMLLKLGTPFIALLNKVVDKLHDFFVVLLYITFKLCLFPLWPFLCIFLNLPNLNHITLSRKVICMCCRNDINIGLAHLSIDSSNFSCMNLFLIISTQHTPNVIQSLKNPSECADRLPVDQTS
jgi:hypothetical protein